MDSTPTNSENSFSTIPSLSEWLSGNPSRTVNDYYKEFGTGARQIPNEKTTGVHLHEIKKSVNTWTWLIPSIAIISILLFLIYDKQSNSFQINKLNSVINLSGKNTIEGLYISKCGYADENGKINIKKIAYAQYLGGAGIVSAYAMIGKIEFRNNKCYITVGNDKETRVGYEIDNGIVYLKDNQIGSSGDGIKIINDSTLQFSDCIFKRKISESN